MVRLPRQEGCSKFLRSISKRRIENQSHKKKRKKHIMPQLLWIFVKSSQRYYYPTGMFSLSKIVRVYAKLISLNNWLGLCSFLFLTDSVDYY